LNHPWWLRQGRISENDPDDRFAPAHLAQLTRQIVPLPSSLKRRLPSFATVIPTGREVTHQFLISSTNNSWSEN